MRLAPLLTPGAAGLRYRAFRLPSEGADLAAWYVPRAGARAGIVLCHGHNDCRTQFHPLLRPLHEAGYALLLFDFRSMGLSGGSVCTYGYREQEDVLAALAWMRGEAGLQRVGLLGYSMGGATALLAAARDPGVEAVVTDSAFARLEDMVEQKFFYLPPRVRGPVSRSVRHWATRWAGDIIGEVDPEAALRAWQPRPLLLIHGEQDLLVPVEHARRLARAGGERAELWTVPGAGHVAARRRAGREYYDRVTGFFGEHLPA